MTKIDAIDRLTVAPTPLHSQTPCRTLLVIGAATDASTPSRPADAQGLIALFAQKKVPIEPSPPRVAPRSAAAISGLMREASQVITYNVELPTLEASRSSGPRIHIDVTRRRKDLRKRHMLHTLRGI